MPKWGRYDGMTAESCEQDERPDGVGWWEVTDVDPEGKKQRPVKTEGLRPDWRCDVCHISRPDEKISVAHHVHLYPRASRTMPPVRVENNVKFCIDKNECSTLARLNDHKGLALRRASADLDALSDRYGVLLTRWKILILAALVLAAVTLVNLIGGFGG